VADLPLLSPATGQTPTLSAHLATKGYVDGQAAVRVTTSATRTANYALLATDMGAEQVYNSASAGTFTLPTNATQAIAVGRAVPIRQSGAGQLTIAGAAGVTLQSRGNAFRLAGQHAVAEARKVAQDTWVLYGDVVV
jgi:predicted RecA/RadA family phage recombinase